jgi:hypothetical protein
MGSVYENAFCTVAASSGRNPHDGIFMSRDPLRYSPCRIPISWRGTWYVTRVTHGGPLTVRDTHLNSRAWVYQEVMLSPRILYYTAFGIFWSCQQGEAFERNYQGWKTPARNFTVKHTSQQGYVDARADVARLRPKRPSLTNDRIFGLVLNSCVSCSSQIRVHGLRDFIDASHRGLFILSKFSAAPVCTDIIGRNIEWSRIISDYTKRSLTKPSDILIALSAIASRLAKAWKYTYVAGLWRETLIYGLQWSNVSPMRGRSRTYRAPSWSWASTHGAITYNVRFFSSITKRLASIISIDIRTHPEDTYQTGQVTDVTLIIYGKLIKTRPSIGDTSSANDVSWDLLLLRENYGFEWFPDAAISLEVSPPAYFMPLTSTLHSETTYFWFSGLVVAQWVTPEGAFDRIGRFTISSTGDELGYIRDFGKGLEVREIVLK